MRLIERWFAGWGLVGGALALGGPAGCFDPGQPIEPTASDGSSGSTGGTSGPTSGSPTTNNPPTDTDTAETTDPTTTIDPDGTTTFGPAECEDSGPNPACPNDAPFCVGGVCVDCTSAPEGACTSLDPSTPVCDEATAECTGCTEHDQCDTGACRIATGECFSESNRLWVDNTFGGCAGGVGTEANPFCTVVEAMEVLNGQAGTEPWAIFVAGSPNPYEGTVDPDNNRPVAIIGPSSGLAATLSNDSAFTVDLWAQSPETYLHRLSVDRGFGGPTIRCNTGQVYVTDSNLLGGDTTADVTGCSLRLRRVTVNSFGMSMSVGSGGELFADQTTFDNSSGGLVVSGTAVLRRSVVSNNYVEGGISVQGGDLTLVNSMVFNNVYQNYGVFVSQTGTAEVVHSTVLGTFACAQMASSVTVRNSIILSPGGGNSGVACMPATIHNSVVDSGEGQGMGNVVVNGAEAGAIFVNPGGQTAADWHVLVGSAPQDVAIHQAGDPVIDFDADPRPTMAGATDYAGADVP